MKKISKFLLAKSIGMYINILSYTAPQKASLLAYRFFSEPRSGRLIKGKLPAILQNAETATVSHEGHEFQTYRWAQTATENEPREAKETVILLIHGWESNAARWEKMLPYLAASGSTIIAIDGPAHGLTTGTEFNVPTYASYIDMAVRKFRPDFLIGHSLGGAACVYYQYKYQNDSIKKMVILGAPSDLKILIRNYVELLSLNSRIVRLLENHFLEKFRFKIDEFSGKIFGSAIGIKGIVAHDVDDDVVAFEEAQKIAGSWKDATFIETKGLGHAMHDDELYKKVSKFLFEAEQ